MMIGTDVRNMTTIMTELILNKYAVAINQDPSPPARNLSGAWYRRLSDGRVAIAQPNLYDASRTFAVDLCADDAFAASSVGDCAASLYDVWAGEDLGVVASPYEVTVGTHDTAFLLATAAS